MNTNNSSNISIEIADIAAMDTDCVVNAANEGLRMGSGVCGAIFDAAGPAKLAEACGELHGCPTGSAVVTPGFDLKARYIIHAVGPVWSGTEADKALLSSCYKASLDLAREQGCHSIAFPLISAGVFGCPVDQVWKQAIKTCTAWLQADPDYGMSIIFAVRKQSVKEAGEKLLR